MIRVRGLVGAVPVLAAAVLVAPGLTAAAHAATACTGMVDVAVGAPATDVATAANAGEVTIVFESGTVSLGNPADRTISETTLYQALGSTKKAAAADRFGASVAVGRSHADPGCSVVAVGAPGADNGAGAVWVFTIDENGLFGSSVRRITQNSSGVPGSAESGDAFGAAVYFGGGVGVRWLAVGAPNEDVGKAKDAGTVVVLPYPGLGSGAKAYTQGSGGVSGAAEKGDHFGAALGPGRDAWSLWVGAPEEDIGALTDAGAIISLPGSISSTGTVRLPGTIGRIKTVTQDSAHVPGTAETGDHFGAVLSGLVGAAETQREPVVGVPGEDVGSAVDAGVLVVTYTDGTWASIQQGSGGVSGTAGAGNRFGASLAVWNQVLLVGVPGADVSGAARAGAVHLMWATGTVPKLSGSHDQWMDQDVTDVADEAEAADGFGTSVALGVHGAVVGVPGEDTAAVTDAGAVAFLPYVDGAPELGLTAADSAILGAADLSVEASAQAGAGFGATAASVVG